jgi:hypothetical protein
MGTSHLILHLTRTKKGQAVSGQDETTRRKRLVFWPAKEASKEPRAGRETVQTPGKSNEKSTTRVSSHQISNVTLDLCGSFEPRLLVW